MKRPSLIPDWRSAWRYLSVQLAAVVVAWGLLPVETQAAIVDWAGVPPSRVPAFLGLLVILGRVIQQAASVEQNDEESEK